MGIFVTVFFSFCDCEFVMNKYQFLEDRQSSPLILFYGELGACQLLRNRQTSQLCILKLAPKAQAIKQIQCLTQANHPNIIKILDYFNHQQNTLIIFELLQGGDLFTKIRCGEIKLKHVASIFRGICQAIQYIHSRKIIHRNLKTETILLDQHFNPKVVDFGLAARIGARRTFCGCCYYMAPEILEARVYDQKVDVWALGVILYEMIYGDVPFSGENPTQVINSIKNSTFFQEQIEEGSFDELMQKMLDPNPTKRPSVSKILQHPILNTEPLNFLSPTQRSPKLRRIQNKIPKSNRSLDRVLQSKRPIYSSDSNKKPIEQPSVCNKIITIIRNKVSALMDGDKVQGNSHYNYVVNN